MKPRKQPPKRQRRIPIAERRRLHASVTASPKEINKALGTKTEEVNEATEAFHKQNQKWVSVFVPHSSGVRFTLFKNILMRATCFIEPGLVHTRLQLSPIEPNDPHQGEKKAQILMAVKKERPRFAKTVEHMLKARDFFRLGTVRFAYPFNPEKTTPQQAYADAILDMLAFAEGMEKINRMRH